MLQQLHQLQAVVRRDGWVGLVAYLVHKAKEVVGIKSMLQGAHLI
jgi:hypothetical protein